jgi:plasmid stabilization system protein ParE
MAYKYRWLEPALDDLSQEIRYVLSEFGLTAARKAEANVREGVESLCSFPNIGVRYEGLTYNGCEVRLLHIRQISIVYCLQDDSLTLISVWNNHRNEKYINAMIQSRQG